MRVPPSNPIASVLSMAALKHASCSECKHAFDEIYSPTEPAENLKHTSAVDYSDRLQAAMAHAKTTRKALADAAGITEAAVGQAINRKTNGFGIVANSRAARFLGVSTDWLATGDGGMVPSQVAHAVSYKPIDDPLLTREQILTMDVLPARFVYALEDDAMGSHGRAGTEVIFVSGYQPKPGAGVLIKDKFGSLHVRRMAQGNRPGHWIGKAPNPQYRDMDSDEDGLELLAVWRGLNNWGLEDA